MIFYSFLLKLMTMASPLIWGTVTSPDLRQGNNFYESSKPLLEKAAPIIDNQKRIGKGGGDPSLVSKVRSIGRSNRQEAMPSGLGRSGFIPQSPPIPVSSNFVKEAAMNNMMPIPVALHVGQDQTPRQMPSQKGVSAQNSSSPAVSSEVTPFFNEGIGSPGRVLPASDREGAESPRPHKVSFMEDEITSVSEQHPQKTNPQREVVSREQSFETESLPTSSVGEESSSALEKTPGSLIEEPGLAFKEVPLPSEGFGPPPPPSNNEPPLPGLERPFHISKKFRESTQQEEKRVARAPLNLAEVVNKSRLKNIKLRPIRDKYQEKSVDGTNASENSSPVALNIKPLSQRKRSLEAFRNEVEQLKERLEQEKARGANASVIEYTQKELKRAEEAVKFRTELQVKREKMGLIQKKKPETISGASTISSDNPPELPPRFPAVSDKPPPLPARHNPSSQPAVSHSISSGNVSVISEVDATAVSSTSQPSVDVPSIIEVVNTSKSSDGHSGNVAVVGMDVRSDTTPSLFSGDGPPPPPSENPPPSSGGSHSLKTPVSGAGLLEELQAKKRMSRNLLKDKNTDKNSDQVKKSDATASALINTQKVTEMLAFTQEEESGTEKTTVGDIKKNIRYFDENNGLWFKEPKAGTVAYEIKDLDDFDDNEDEARKGNELIYKIKEEEAKKVAAEKERAEEEERTKKASEFFAKQKKEREETDLQKTSFNLGKGNQSGKNVERGNEKIPAATFNGPPPPPSSGPPPVTRYADKVTGKDEDTQEKKAVETSSGATKNEENLVAIAKVLVKRRSVMHSDDEEEDEDAGW